MPTLRDFIEKINIRAEVALEAPMAPRTSFGIGGPAEALVRPLDPESASRLFAEARAEGIPIFVLGGGANILVGDRGLRGIVLELSALASTRIEGGCLYAGAGLPVEGLCLSALARGLAGLEDFAGMPGSVGGAAWMNARCYELEMADRLAWVEVLGSAAVAEGRPIGDRIRRRPGLAAEWSYKRSPFQPGGPEAGALILGAAFRLAPGDPARIARVMRERRADREAKGQYRLPSAGSVFKNDRGIGRPAGKILEELGLKGRRIGGAMVSAWHANIFVNAGGARAADMRALIELARSEARSRLGLELEPEILFVGEF